MKLTSRATILVTLATVVVLVPAVAFGAYSAGTSNPGNAVAAGVLKGPGTLTATAHVADNATNRGDVTLTWNDGLSNAGTITPGGYLIERQAAGSTEWQSAATPAYASVCDNASHACTFTDATAAFNTTYSYRIRSTVSNWTAGPTTVRLAASIAPSAAEERAAPAALNSVAYSASGLIAVGDGGRIMVCAGSCTGNASWQAATSPTSNDLYRVVFEAAGRAWAAGAGGTLLTCASSCTSTSATWTNVNVATTASLYGIAATSGYVAVVGANLTMRFTTDAAFGSWQSGTVGVGTPTTTLYGIVAKNAKNVVVIGSRGSGTHGVIAGCTTGSNNVCGVSAAFTAVGYASESSAPMADMRDMAHVSGGGNDNIYVVGTGGNVYVSTSLTTGYTKKSTGSSADLYAVAAVSQSAGGAVGDPTSSAASTFLRCTASCAGSGAWSAGADTGTTNRLSGIAGSGTSYWAVGSGGTIRYFNGTTWTAQSSPSSASTVAVSPARVQANDGNRYALATATSLGTACTAPALLATATVPARSSSAVTSPTVKVTIGYDFDGGTNTSRVSLSANGGGTWSGAALTSNVAAATVKTVDFTGDVPAADSAQQIQLCVQGTGGNGHMNVDMVHIDVEE